MCTHGHTRGTVESPMQGRYPQQRRGEGGVCDVFQWEAVPKTKDSEAVLGFTAGTGNYFMGLGNV